MWYIQWNYHTNFLDLHERRLCVSAGRQRFQKWLMRDNEVGGMFIYYILIMLSCLVFSLKSTSNCISHHPFQTRFFEIHSLFQILFFIGFHCASLRRAGKFANFPPNSRIWQCAWGDIYMFMQPVIAFIQLISNKNSHPLESNYNCIFWLWNT